MTPYEAGYLEGTTGDACEQSKAEHEGRAWVYDPHRHAEARAKIQAWYQTPEGVACKAQQDEIVRLETLVLTEKATAEDIAAYRLAKESPPWSEFNRGIEAAADKQVAELMDWLFARKGVQS